MTITFSRDEPVATVRKDWGRDLKVHLTPEEQVAKDQEHFAAEKAKFDALRVTPNPKGVKKWMTTPAAKLRLYLDRDISDQDKADIQAALNRKTGGSKRVAGAKVKDVGSWSSQFSDWQSKLSPEEVGALKSYTGTAFSGRVNTALRKGKSLSADDATKASTLTAAIHNAPPLKEDTQVFRGLSTLPDSWKRGTVVADPGFMSTTVDRATAQRNFGNVVMSIKVPAGTHGAFMGQSISPKFENEQEFLLPPNTKVRISGVTSAPKQHAVIVNAEVVPA